MRILIVDDSKAMRRIVKRTLQQAGWGEHEVVEAESADNAIELMQEIIPDLILSDWNMPGRTGLDFLRHLRAGGIHVPFGFVTSEGTEDMRSAASEAGACFMLAKPFTPEDMKRVLDGLQF